MPTPVQFKISSLAEADRETLNAVAELTFRAWGRDGRPDEVGQRVRNLQTEIAALNPDSKAMFVASTRDGVVGFVKTAAFEEAPSEWWLIGLVVSRNYRRMGVATALTEACAEHARAHDATTLKSETHSDNEASIRFHEAFGFACTGAFVASDGDHKVGFALDLRHRLLTQKSGTANREQRKTITVQYSCNTQIRNAELNDLFSASWPTHTPRDFLPTLVCSLGYICAFVEDHLVGFVNVAWDGDKHAFLLDPTVRPEWQRRGIGTELFRQAVELTRSKGVEWLHVDYEPRLAEFYRHCGFRETAAGLMSLKGGGR
jgi:ribosomal protein S18 acetylase RimI-like enzyme